MNHRKNHSSGLTLAEMMVAMAIAGISLSIIYAFSINYVGTYDSYNMSVELQQGLRNNMQLMERELRHAGFNPGGLSKDRAGDDSVDNNCNGTTDELDNSLTATIDESEAIGIKSAQLNAISFLMDIDGNGTACGDLESISYTHNGTTVKRNGVPKVGNIDVLNFVYLDGNGAVATSVDAIRSVQVTIVGRTAREDSSYRNTKSYYNLQGQEVLAPQNDGYHRRILTSQVHFRNLQV